MTFLLKDTAEQYVATNGIRLHVVTAGPPDSPLLLLLHGFPEFWYGWRQQIPFLARSGFHVWAPDQRGYNLSDKPAAVKAYHLNALRDDVAGLIQAAGRQQAVVVGHDWGAAVAWWLAATRPERVARLVILNVPHPSLFARYLQRTPSQWRRSWYILAFQPPFLPEILARRRNWLALAQALLRSSRPGTFDEVALEHYRQAWSQPGAISGMLNWYRAAARASLRLSQPQPVTVPTLIIWGARDVALNRELAGLSLELCRDGRLVMIEEASHWVQHEEPERVNRLILDFVAGSAG